MERKPINRSSSGVRCRLMLKNIETGQTVKPLVKSAIVPVSEKEAKRVMDHFNERAERGGSPWRYVIK